MSDVLLPEGALLLHIGPHKTGTTTLQAAFHQSRDALEAQGVHYAGRRAHSMVAAMAAARRQNLPTLTGAADDEWRALVAEVAGSTASRVVVSSEFYADAAADRVPAIVEALGGDRVHVAVTLRSLVRILPSQWQQYMQNRMVVSYEDWLHEMLRNAAETKVTPSFWLRHRHDTLVRRWVDVVGPDRLRVVVVDETDPQALPRAFEDLLGLDAGTLRRQESANRSLTLPEVELLRAFNGRWRDRELTEADYTRLVRFGAARHLQQRLPVPGEERLVTPQWAVDRAFEVQREMLDAIGALGVQVLGDLHALLDPGLARDVGENQPVDRVPVEVAVKLAAGLVRSVADVPRRPAPPDRVVGELEAAARARPPGVVRGGDGQGPTTAVERTLRRRLHRLRGRLRRLRAQ